MRDGFLNELTEGECLALPFIFEFWAMEHQLPPGGDWRSWVIMGGRGAGKTRAGAEWVRACVEGAMPLSPGRCKRVALIGAGWYGKIDLFRLIQVAPVEVVALCDVDSTMLSEAADMVAKRQKSGKRPKTYGDYRKLLKEDGP